MSIARRCAHRGDNRIVIADGVVLIVHIYTRWAADSKHKSDVRLYCGFPSTTVTREQQLKGGGQKRSPPGV